MPDQDINQNKSTRKNHLCRNMLNECREMETVLFLPARMAMVVDMFSQARPNRFPIPSTRLISRTCSTTSA